MATPEKKILIVEDDDLLRKIMVAQMTSQYVCLEAKDGQEALQKIISQQPEIIILDLLLPTIDGFEVLRQLRAHPNEKIAKIPVLVVSNLDDKQSMKEAQTLGISAYYTKSEAQFGVILKKIGEVLGS